MGIGVSIFLIAAGAILAFAVEVSAEGVDLNTVGVILLVIGIIGLIASMVFWSDWGGYRRDRRVVVHDDPDVVREVPRGRRTVVREEY